MAASFVEVRQYLMESFLPELPPDLEDPAKAWIETLDPADESDLLATSLAIDLESGALSPSHLEPIFRQMSLPVRSARRAFAEAVRRCPESLKLQSRHRAEHADEPPPTYANTLDLTAFLQSYVIPSYPDLTPDDLERARFVFFGDDADPQEPTLEEIEETYQSPGGLVWVGPDEVYRGRVTDRESGTLHDILGLGDKQRGEMVHVTYPSGFQPEDCRQPTVLDCVWDRSGGCYVSAAEGDCWGRTQGRSGTEPPVKERIHGPLRGLSEEFTARLLNEPEIAPRNLAALRSAALQRFHDLRQGGSAHG